MSADSIMNEPTSEQTQSADEHFDGTIHIPLQTNPLNLNAVSHMHWATKAKHTREWRMYAKAQAARYPALSFATITLTWFVVDRRRRDTINMSLLMKALTDGIVDAGVIPDDTPQYVDTQCRIERAPEGTRVAYMELRVQGGAA